MKTDIKPVLTTLVPGLLRRLNKSLGLGLAEFECAEFVEHFFNGVQVDTFKITGIQAQRSWAEIAPLVTNPLSNITVTKPNKI